MSKLQKAVEATTRKALTHTLKGHVEDALFCVVDKNDTPFMDIETHVSPACSRITLSKNDRRLARYICFAHQSWRLELINRDLPARAYVNRVAGFIRALPGGAHTSFRVQGGTPVLTMYADDGSLLAAVAIRNSSIQFPWPHNGSGQECLVWSGPSRA